MEEEGEIMPTDLHIESLQFTLPAWEYTIVTDPASEALSSAGDATLVNASGSTRTIRSVAVIDIQGWTSRLENTFYPASISIQRGMSYRFTDGGSGDACWDLLFVMPRELTDAEETQIIGLDYPAFLGKSDTETSSIDKQHVMYGQWNFVASNSTVGGYGTVMDSSQFGTGLPTLANRLHVYRYTHIELTGSHEATYGLTGPAINGIIEGAFGKEPDLEYMERLRRTFVLASDLE